MRSRIKRSGKAKGLAAALCVLGVASVVVIPAAASAESSPAVGGMSLMFASGKAKSVADNLAVPVTCVGEGNGFCSGVVTLSHKGHHTSIPFSVRAGGHDLLFVPLRLHVAKHPRRVHGVATTVQPRGPATSSKEFLYAR